MGAAQAPSGTPRPGGHADRGKQLLGLHQRLANEVDALRTGDDWQRWLATAARFYNYSFQNTLLIHAQRPNATHVAGYQTWQGLGRQVTKGERGIAILAPVVRRSPYDSQAASAVPDTASDDSGRVLAGFRVAHVWDVSQTAGQPLPEQPRPALLRGEAPVGLWTALADQVAANGFSLDRGACGSANGITNFLTASVRVRDDVDDAQAVKTLAHELGHVLLHRPDSNADQPTCRGVAEVEAESVAHLVAAAHGLDTDGYTFPYIAHWADTVGAADAVRTTGQRVLRAAATLLDRAEALMVQPRRPVGSIEHRAETVERGAGVEGTRAVAHRAELRGNVDGSAAAVREQYSEHRVAGVDRAELLAVLQTTHDFFVSGVTGSWVPDYLASRSLDAALGEPWGAGYAPAGWTTLVQHLNGRGFTPQSLIAAGVAMRTRNGRAIDRFRDRLTLPVRNVEGEVVSFVARARPGADTGTPPRYLNGPATEIYAKGTLLFGLSEGADQLARGARAALVEGPFDAIAVTDGTDGRCVGIATCGTAVTAAQIDQLVVLGSPIDLVVALDDDEAGRAAAERILTMLSERNLVASAAGLPADHDPAEVVHRLGPTALTAALTDKSIGLADSVIRSRVAQWSDRMQWVEGRLGALRSVAPVMARLPPAECKRLIPAVAELTRVDLPTIHREVSACLDTWASCEAVAAPPGGGLVASPGRAPRLERVNTRRAR